MGAAKSFMANCPQEAASRFGPAGGIPRRPILFSSSPLPSLIYRFELEVVPPPSHHPPAGRPRARHRKCPESAWPRFPGCLSAARRAHCHRRRPTGRAGLLAPVSVGWRCGGVLSGAHSAGHAAGDSDLIREQDAGERSPPDAPPARLRVGCDARTHLVRYQPFPSTLLVLAAASTCAPDP